MGNMDVGTNGAAKAPKAAKTVKVAKAVKTKKAAKETVTAKDAAVMAAISVATEAALLFRPLLVAHVAASVGRIADEGATRSSLCGISTKATAALVDQLVAAKSVDEMEMLERKLEAILRLTARTVEKSSTTVTTRRSDEDKKIYTR